jgi:hypothetical protein
MTVTATKTKKTATKRILTAAEWAAKVVVIAKKAIAQRGTKFRVFECKAPQPGEPLPSVWDRAKPMTPEEEEVFCSTPATHNNSHHSDDPIKNGCFQSGITSDGRRLLKGLVPLVVTLPAGDYYISDPWYVLGAEDRGDCFKDGKYDGAKDGWMDVLDACDRFFKPYVKNGMTAVAFRTSCGDGTYYDQHDREYGADVGMIACVPVAMVDRTEYLERKDLLHKVTFTASFDCMVHDGIIIFGDIVIDTRCD